MAGASLNALKQPIVRGLPTDIDRGKIRGDRKIKFPISTEAAIIVSYSK
ncbi:hypothetical protein QUA75_17420 [Microcoleus sp. M2_C6]